jgi:beta-glucosidase
MIHVEPFDPSSEADRAAAAAQDRFMNRWYLEGITTGRVGAPVGHGEEIAGLADSFDVFGINYYFRSLVRADTMSGFSTLVRRPGEPHAFTDEMGWEVHPPGLGILLRSLKPLAKPVYVTENGHATLDEGARTRHLWAHLDQVLGAVADGVDVRGFFYWSLIDNFEWAEGWTRHFGLMGMEPGTLTRQPRPAAAWYRDVIRANALPAACPR